MSLDITHAVKQPGVPCLVSDLDFFSPPPLLEAIEYSFHDKISPLTPISDTSEQINFQVEPSEYFIDLGASYVSLKATIFMPDGSALAANEEVAFVDYVTTALFSNFDYRLNNQSVTSNYNTYNYYGYLSYLLSSNYDYRSCKAQLAGCYPEANKTVNDFTLPTGFKARGLLTALSAVASFQGLLVHPLANQDKYLPPMLQQNFCFTKASSRVCLKAKKNEAYKYKITEMSLYIRKVKMSADFQIEFEKSFMERPCLYPIKQSFVKDYTISSGVITHHVDNPFLNSFIPSLVVLGLVDQESWSGDITKDPYNFEHGDLKDVSFLIDGKISPSIPFDTDFTSAKNKDWARAFASLFFDDLRSQTSINIDYDSYITGNCLFGFTFGNPLSCSDLTFPKKLGSPRLSLVFKKATTKVYKLVMFCQFSETLCITADRQIVRNYVL